jgi:hypothetical protein
MRAEFVRSVGIRGRGMCGFVDWMVRTLFIQFWLQMDLVLFPFFPFCLCCFF